ncbi:hypothetical protein HanHA300_Chr02g0043061 [Helianthus annuus]|nr:hypothetical protein HanHA300_Chr02g0043061 [Helianthus annuus]
MAVGVGARCRGFRLWGGVSWCRGRRRFRGLHVCVTSERGAGNKPVIGSGHQRPDKREEQGISWCAGS